MSDDFKFFGFLGLVTAAAIGLMALAIQGEMRWQEWAREHCQKIGYRSGDVGFGTGVSASGNPTVVTVVTAGKTGYRCDDGMEYWR